MLPYLIGAACGSLFVIVIWRYRAVTTVRPFEEFHDLQISLGAEPAPPDVIALKDAEIAGLTERLLDLESLGRKIELIEKRHIAERERLEKELLEASLLAEERKSYERRWKAIRTRYRTLKARLEELPEDLNEAEDELVAARKERERAEQREQGLQKEVTSLKKRLTRREKLLEKTNARLDRVLEDNEKQRAAAAKLRQDQVELKRELRTLRDEAKAREAELAEAHERLQHAASTAADRPGALPAAEGEEAASLAELLALGEGFESLEGEEKASKGSGGSK